MSSPVECLSLPDGLLAVSAYIYLVIIFVPHFKLSNSTCITYV